MRGGKWLILTALQREANAVERALRNAGLSDWKCEVIGIRAVHFRPQILRDCQRVLLVGLAGALDPSLHVGDCLACIGLGEWKNFSMSIGRIYTSEKIVSTTAAKSDLFHLTGAQAVDMEHSIVAKAALEMKVPMLNIRAISDTADEELPEKLGDWVTDIGQPKIAALAGGIARKPGQVKQLMRLGKNSRVALDAVANAVCKLLQAYELEA